MVIEEAIEATTHTIPDAAPGKRGCFLFLLLFMLVAEDAAEDTIRVSCRKKAYRVSWYIRYAVRFSSLDPRKLACGQG